MASGGPAGGTINIGVSGWQQIPSVNPGDGLTTVFLAATQDSAYDLDLTYEAGNFDIYWYVWVTDPNIDQDDTLVFEVSGAFAMGGGNDTLTGGLLEDNRTAYLLGGAGDDVINQSPSFSGLYKYGGSGNDTIVAGAAGDVLYGDEADAFVLWPTVTGFIPVLYDLSLDGNDSLAGALTGDTTAGEGNDTMNGGGGNDTVTGNVGDDSLSATSGDNQLFGGDGADTIVGGTGSDFIYGGPRGTDRLDLLTGGGGADTFILSYSSDNSDTGAGFWASYFDQASQDVANSVARKAIAAAIDAAEDAVAAGILAAGLGAIGGDLAAAFVGWVEGLLASPTPVSRQDVMVVTDFDPREDILVLPLQPTVLTSLTATLVKAEQVPGGGSGDAWAVAFNDGQTIYAYAELSADFLADMNLDPAGDGAEQVLKNLFAFNTQIKSLNGTVGFSNLVQPSISDAITGGPFQAQTGTLAPNTAVAVYGAVGGVVIYNGEGETYGSVLAGTNYADALSTNSSLFDPVSGNGSLSSTAAYIYGFGGADLIYGTDQADTLSGGDGDDALYSFVTTLNSDQNVDPEKLLGGTGDDTLYGGGSGGTFDGGDGSDTFSVVYLEGYGQALQVAIDLVNGFAAERKQPTGDTAAPVSAEMPWGAPGEDSVVNTYTLSGMENAIGGPLNDWIRAAQGSVIEGGAGADYIDANAGAVTISYAGSAAAVSVQLFASGAVTSGGDAEGDVLEYGDALPVALIGSVQGDTLASVFTDGLTFTGGGGADLFRMLSLPDRVEDPITITDFSETDGDVLDLRAVGITKSEVLVLESEVVVFQNGFANRIVLEGFKGTPEILYADSVSGVGRAASEGGALAGGDGQDDLKGRAGADSLHGKGADDVVAGQGGDDLLRGGAGDDDLRGGSGDDRITGDEDDDTLDGAGGDDVLEGGSGQDSLSGGVGKDRLLAGDGDDRGAGGDGADSLDGEAGNDSLYGGEGRDELHGREGDDSLAGGLGDDQIRGGEGRDTIQGGAGRDLIDGGAGADVMRGGLGADTFRLVVGSIDGDAILDFDAAEGDRLLIEGTGPIGVVALGNGMFSVTDGALFETIAVRGAVFTDFEVVIA